MLLSSKTILVYWFLSEMAGAAVELTDALLVNPNDTEQIENAICRALEMPFEEQQERMHRMQSIVSVQTVNKWAADFVNEWQEVAHKNKTMLFKKIGSQNMQEIQHQYLHAKKRLILLDYDGTLALFRKGRKMPLLLHNCWIHCRN